MRDYSKPVPHAARVRVEQNGQPSVDATPRIPGESTDELASESAHCDERREREDDSDADAGDGANDGTPDCV